MIAKLIQITIGLRIPEEHEVAGIDEHAHAERAYEDEDLEARA